MRLSALTRVRSRVMAPRVELYTAYVACRFLIFLVHVCNHTTTFKECSQKYWKTTSECWKLLKTLSFDEIFLKTLQLLPFVQGAVTCARKDPRGLLDLIGCLVCVLWRRIGAEPTKSNQACLHKWFWWLYKWKNSRCNFPWLLILTWMRGQQKWKIWSCPSLCNQRAPLQIRFYIVEFLKNVWSSKLNWFHFVGLFEFCSFVSVTPILKPARN